MVKTAGYCKLDRSPKGFILITDATTQVKEKVKAPKLLGGVVYECRSKLKQIIASQYSVTENTATNQPLNENDHSQVTNATNESSEEEDEGEVSQENKEDAISINDIDLSKFSDNQLKTLQYKLIREQQKCALFMTFSLLHIMQYSKKYSFNNQT